MLHTRLSGFEKLDRCDDATAILGVLVIGASALIAVLLYMPIR